MSNDPERTRLELYPFLFFDPIRRRWVRARYRATFEDIANQGRPFQITGPAWTPSGVGGGSASHLA